MSSLRESPALAMPSGRTAMPQRSTCAFTSPMETRFLWKMDAASPASAPATLKTSVKCAGQPAPDEASSAGVAAAAVATVNAPGLGFYTLNAPADHKAKILGGGEPPMGITE